MSDHLPPGRVVEGASSGAVNRAPASVFAGRGMFTVERPDDAAGLKRDWQANRSRIPSDDWYRSPNRPSGVIRQDESADQYRHALALGWDGFDEGALVTTLDGSYHMLGSWPDGWTCMPECYWNADGGIRRFDGRGRHNDIGRSVPNMIFRARQVIGDKWGSVPVVPVVGCYDASGENPGVGVRLTLPDYLPDLEAALREHPCVVGYAIWRVETLDPRDLELLR